MAITNTLIRLDNSLDSIRSARTLCHSLSISAILIGGLCWSLPPFLIQGKSNLAIVGRYFSLLGTAGAGAILLVCSNYLQKTNTIVIASQKASENLLIEQLTYSQFAQQSYYDQIAKELPPILANQSINESLSLDHQYPPAPVENTAGNNKLMIAPTNQGEIIQQEQNYIDDLPPDLLAILNLARESGELSIRELQRSSIGKKMKITADGARYAFERLQELEYGIIEVNKTTVKFIPSIDDPDSDIDD